MSELERDQVVLEIGYINIHFNNFEMLLNELNTTLINYYQPEIGHFISSQKTIEGKLQLCNALINMFPFQDKEKNKLFTNLSDFKSIRIERNKYIHGILHDILDESENKLDGPYLHNLKEYNFNSEKIKLSTLVNIKLKIKNIVNYQNQLNKTISEEYFSILKQNEKEQENHSKLFNDNASNDI